jgi:hypothetical protein
MTQANSGAVRAAERCGDFPIPDGRHNLLQKWERSPYLSLRWVA